MAIDKATLLDDLISDLAADAYALHWNRELVNRIYELAETRKWRSSDLTDKRIGDIMKCVNWCGQSHRAKIDAILDKAKTNGTYQTTVEEIFRVAYRAAS